MATLSHQGSEVITPATLRASQNRAMSNESSLVTSCYPIGIIGERHRGTADDESPINARQSAHTVAVHRTQFGEAVSLPQLVHHGHMNIRSRVAHGAASRSIP